MRRGRDFILLAACALMSMPLTASAAQTQSYGVFDVTFFGVGEGTGLIAGEQNWTAPQMQSVGEALMAWCSGIANTPARQIRVHLFWSELDSAGANVLGGSASYRAADGTTIWNLGELVWKENYDPGQTGYGFDTIIQYDITCAGQQWNFSQAAPKANEVDFRSVISHEIGHSLGFDSSYDREYDDWGWIGDQYAGLTAWEKNLVDSSGNKPSSGGYGTPGDFNEADAPVYWDGENASALLGAPVPVYAPNPFEPGSSLVHLDESTFDGLMMTPAIATGQMARTVSDLEWAMMKDMGWSVVPEPATLLLLAAGALGLVRRRKTARSSNR